MQTKIKSIQRTFGEIGHILNEYERTDFKVSNEIKERADKIRPVLLSLAVRSKEYSAVSTMFLYALKTAEDIADGQAKKSAFKETCDNINVYLRGRDGVWL